MKFEKLNENKIRIILNFDDLINNNVDFHSIVENDESSQKLINTMLNKAEKEIGFHTDDEKLLVEAIISPEENFIFTVTKVSKDFSAKDFKKKFQVKKKSLPTNIRKSFVCI